MLRPTYHWLVLLLVGCGRLGFDASVADDADAAADDAGATAQLIAPAAQGPDDNFGWSVALRDDRIVIGAPTAVSGGAGAAGVAYLFSRDSSRRWVESQRLEATGLDADARFGERVGFCGDAIVVASSGEDGEGGADVGAVHVFRDRGSGFEPAEVLSPSDGAGADFFGIALATSDSRLVVGAHYDDPGEQGAAYVFDTDGAVLVESQKLVALTTDGGDNFGAAVSMSSDGQFIAVGAPYKEGEGLVAVGAAYVFELDGAVWRERADLRPDNPHDSMFFGFAVAIDGDWLAVSASQENLPAQTDAGVVDFYRRGPSGEWLHHSRIVPSDSAADAQFGNHIALAGAAVLIGAPFASGGTGSIYRFELRGDAWVEKAAIGGAGITADGHLGEGLGLDVETMVSGAHRAFGGEGRVYVAPTN